MRSMKIEWSAWAFVIVQTVACAGPSRAEIAERDAEVRRLTTAKAVHLPKGVDSCVGVTMRLTDPNTAPAERDLAASLVTDQEAKDVLEKAGALACREPYLAAVREGSASPEPIQIAMTYGVDPAGKVCAVVEKQRMEPVDPGAVGLLEDGAECLKNALFRAAFPAGRAVDKTRVVRTYVLIADPAQDKTVSMPAPEQVEKPVGSP